MMSSRLCTSFQVNSFTFLVSLKVEDAVESLSREILTIQGRGDKRAAQTLLSKHCVMTQPLKSAVEKLEMIEVYISVYIEFAYSYLACHLIVNFKLNISDEVCDA